MFSLAVGRSILAVAVPIVTCACVASATEHPRLLFDHAEAEAFRSRVRQPPLDVVADRLMRRAEALLSAPPLLVSLTGRGEPDPPGQIKGLTAARRLQGRVLTFAMAYRLVGDLRYYYAAVRELDHALERWKIWVDTAHAPPYDLMTGELALTFGLAYDWLYHDFTDEERRRLREGAERRALTAYLEGATRDPPMNWLRRTNNWNPVCNGGAAVLALALEGESSLSARVLELAIPGMRHYWDYIAEDGGSEEGTGYWRYGHRYAFIAAEALRRAGKRGGADVFTRPAARRTGYFPIVFNPGRVLSASFGDSSGRANDPVFYLLAREYRNPDFVWFQDRAAVTDLDAEGWPQEALALLWRPVGEAWLPEANPGFKPALKPVQVFPSINWALMAPSLPDPPFFLAFKNGSLAASHTHLDLNHVSVAYGDTMLAVELGSRPYPADYFSPRRWDYYEIGTAGHNAVLVGGKGLARGRRGRLLGPITGEGYTALVGVADDAYEVPTPHARRHVVLMDDRYFVLLDEVRTARPEAVELRFHTYGTVRAGPSGGWTFEQDEAALDLTPALNGWRGAVEEPSGWITPVRALRFQTAGSAVEAVAVTVLHPRARGEPRLPVRAGRRGTRLTVKVGADEMILNRAAHGWHIERITLGARGADKKRRNERPSPSHLPAPCASASCGPVTTQTSTVT